MLSIDCKRNKDGTPVLSAKDIDIDAECLLEDYNSSLLKEPCEIPVDSFVENYQGLSIDYQYLSHCGVYLGMMVFNDTDRIAIYNPVKNSAEYFAAKGGTIIIDKTLLEDDQEQRYRFTLAHEGPGHGVYHYPYYKKDKNQMTLFDFGIGESPAPEIKCRIFSGGKKTTKKALVTKDDWMEWQANCMASAFLMPKCTLKMLLKDYCSSRELQEGISDTNRALSLVSNISKIYNVSHSAAFYRLQKLGYISVNNKHYRYEDFILSDCAW